MAAGVKPAALVTHERIAVETAGEADWADGCAEARVAKPAPKVERGESRPQARRQARKNASAEESGPSIDGCRAR